MKYPVTQSNTCMINYLKFFVLSSLLLLFSIDSSACTNLLVGKKASADGSTFISYSADSYGMYGKLVYLPAAKHGQGAMRKIIDGDTNHYLGEIPEAPVTYSVMGNINEYQVSIMETTFGGRDELVDPNGIIDYVSLMALGLQRAKTAREAIQVMTSLVAKYGYASGGESFSIADPNEIWILEMIGKGKEEKGAVWVAVRIPDDCIAAHANHSRIHRFDLKDKANVMYAKDVISFARKKGYFKGKDSDFDFSAAYAPADFGAMRFCEARVWSFYNRWVEGMEKYVDYVAGKQIGQLEPMPLYLKPKQKLALRDVMDSMRDHYEGTPFDLTADCGMGAYESPYRPTPLTYEFEGKKYFNERPISTQQAAFVVVAQLRSWLPNSIGGILWFANDEANTTPFTPIYCSANKVPECYSGETATDVSFSWKSAFWVCNWVANMTYPRYSLLFPSVKSAREELENQYAARQHEVENKALALYKESPEKAVDFLTEYTVNSAQKMLHRWKQLGEYLIVKYNDQAIREEENGQFKMTPDGLGASPKRVGFPESYRKRLIKETGEKYLVPQQ